MENSFDLNNKKILSALIGLAGAQNNNGKTETTDEVVIEAILFLNKNERKNLCDYGAEKQKQKNNLNNANNSAERGKKCEDKIDENISDINGLLANNIEKIHNEKFKISPGCATCMNPCGNTSDYDMNEWEQFPEEEQRIKEQIWTEVKNKVEDLNSKGETDLPAIIYKAISFIGYGLEMPAYEKLLYELKNN